MYAVRALSIEDYDDVLALWQAVEGVGLSSADSREAIARYLERNPGLSLAAYDGAGRLVGAVLAGHDGRRGYLHHLAVRADCRGQGLGRLLVDRAMQLLKAEGIEKCHLFIFEHNAAGRAFWKRAGWKERPELVIASKDL